MFRGCHDHERGPKFTSLSQTLAWLKTLPDVSEDVELRRIQEAVQVLQKPAHQAVVRICAQWQQAQMRNRKHSPVAVIVEELTENVLDAGNRAQRRVAARCGAAQPAASSGAAQPTHDDDAMLNFTSLRESSVASQPASSGGAAQPANDDEAMLNFTSLSEVGAWLETLPHVGGDAELRRIQETVQVLQKPTHQALVHICAQWHQAQKRKGKHLPVAVIVQELTVNVFDASNSAQRRVATRGGAAQPAASSGAAQPTHDDEAMLNCTSLRESSGAALPASSGGAAQPAHDDEAMLNFTSLKEIGAWLETLPHVGGDAELRMIQEAVQVLQKPTKQEVERICAQWQQAHKRNRKHLPVTVIVK